MRLESATRDVPNCKSEWLWRRSYGVRLGSRVMRHPLFSTASFLSFHQQRHRRPSVRQTVRFFFYTLGPLVSSV